VRGLRSEQSVERCLRIGRQSLFVVFYGPPGDAECDIETAVLPAVLKPPFLSIEGAGAPSQLAAIDVGCILGDDVYDTGEGIGAVNRRAGSADDLDPFDIVDLAKVLAKTKVIERFTEHDLRAKCASDAESLEHAQALLSHADSKITAQVYRRKPTRVRPLR
jgi:hypothetical protein